MPTIAIDQVEYDLDKLSDAAKAQIQMIQLVDQEIARLNTLLAIAQTARAAYANSLKAALAELQG
jgi:hypothetical protein